VGKVLAENGRKEKVMFARYSSALVLVFALVFVASAWAGTFKDDFQDGDLEGWEQFWPKGAMLWEVIDGELACSRVTDHSAEIITGDVSWTDYTIECDVKLVEDHGAGDFALIVRVSSGNAGYGFLVGDWVGESAAYTQKWPDLSMKVIQPLEPLELGVWHHLKLEVEDNEFTYWINDEMAIEYDDDLYRSGKLGFGVANYTVRCDNVVITGPDVPNIVPDTWPNEDVGPGRSVKPGGRLITTWASIKRSAIRDQ
jgi:hypothetical protein